MKVLRYLAVGLIALVVIAYAGMVGLLYFKQRDFQYSPAGEITELAATALRNAEAVAIPTADGAVVNGWYAPPQAGKPVILFYKGNTGSFSAEYERYETWTAEGYGFLAFDYRGFPLSPGSINQAGVLADAMAAFDWLAAKGAPILIWGRSLGTGPATYVASERSADALLLETPFLSAATVAAERYWFAPVRWLMQDQFPVDEWIRTVEEPVLVAHGTADETIAVSNGERVYALAPRPHELWIVPGGTHGDLWDHGLWAKAKEFFAAVGPGAGAPQPTSH